MRKFFLFALVLAFTPFTFAQQALNNGSVIKLIKSGLSEDLIITTINASAGTYDTSADGIIALKTAGASDKIIASIVTKANAPQTVPPLAPMPQEAQAGSGSSLPPGIDDIGVYYKNPAGTWTAIDPEIVNFKSGGVLKSMMTNGFIKGDMNGHINGAHAALSLNFPVTLCVYVPEGTAITEYQLLRLRENTDYREFRSVTGGIVHTSGGATRDQVEFKGVKIASRIYTITLDASLKSGEYGLLPPGATGSSNMGSSGKIYSISVKE